MDMLKSGGLAIGIRATVYARHCYRDIFKAEIDGDLNKLFSDDVGSLNAAQKRFLSSMSTEQLNKLMDMRKSGEDNALEILEEAGITMADIIAMGVAENTDTQIRLDEEAVMRVIYAMNTASNKFEGKDTKPFLDWLCENQDFDIRDCWERFEEEVKHGFFRNKVVQPTASA